MNQVVDRTELLQPEPAQALSALLGVATPNPGEGLPPLWHWIYLLDRPAEADLGPDGHPIRNVVPTPPAPGRRRMWAGGRVRTIGRLEFGIEATRHTEVLEVDYKQGRTGPLTFVRVGHHIEQAGRTIIEERQDIVYRQAAQGHSSVPDPDPAARSAAGGHVWSIDISPTLLFRFSALTYNAHRIHYDRDYARDVEGYPGLLVHGPLQAIAMAEAARAQGATGDGVFEYRFLAPLFDHQGMFVECSAGDHGLNLDVRDRSRRRVASATWANVS